MNEILRLHLSDADGPDSAVAFAERLMAPPRRAFGRNAIGAAPLADRLHPMLGTGKACPKMRRRTP